MSKRLRVFLLVATVLVVALGVPALAQAKAAPTVTKPKFSAAPVAGVPFTVSGVVRPKATHAVPYRGQGRRCTRSRTAAGSSRTVSREARRRRLRHAVLPPAHRPGGGQVRRQGVPLSRRQACRQVRARRVRRGAACHHRLQRQRVDGAGTRGGAGAVRHAPGRRLHHAGRLGRPACGRQAAQRRGALHLGRVREGRRRRADLAHRRPASRVATTGCATGCPSTAPAAWSSPSRSTSTRCRTRTRTRCRTCRRTSRSARSAPRAWGATAASPSSRASSPRRARTRSSGTPTASSPGATTGSAGWTTATTASWWSTTQRTWPSTRIRTTS